mmetsp:Transcript_10957/g.24136  ORF Transcript_10957/g.24136 Transcript_10957/m.24136 type:complete len:202 (-) Transcript_10957:1281-1886(-)
MRSSWRFLATLDFISTVAVIFFTSVSSVETFSFALASPVALEMHCWSSSSRQPTSFFNWLLRSSIFNSNSLTVFDFDSKVSFNSFTVASRLVTRSVALARHTVPELHFRSVSSRRRASFFKRPVVSTRFCSRSTTAAFNTSTKASDIASLSCALARSNAPILQRLSSSSRVLVSLCNLSLMSTTRSLASSMSNRNARRPSL